VLYYNVFKNLNLYDGTLVAVAIERLSSAICIGTLKDILLTDQLFLHEC
jgi:hypothetical protein